MNDSTPTSPCTGHATALLALLRCSAATILEPYHNGPDFPLSPIDVSCEFGISLSELKRLRIANLGPECATIGPGVIVYRRGDVALWLEQQAERKSQVTAPNRRGAA